MADEMKQAGEPNPRPERGPDRRHVDRRRGGKKANKLFYSNWAHSVLIGVIIFLGIAIWIQDQQQKISFSTVEALHKQLLEQNDKNK
jgi:hypothetical protein